MHIKKDIKYAFIGVPRFILKYYLNNMNIELPSKKLSLFIDNTNDTPIKENFGAPDRTWTYNPTIMSRLH